jgi:hypothetical protein
MEELINVNWYIEPPIDFEYKQYKLLAYLQKVDDAFIKKILSPHLLYLEKLEIELLNYKTSFDVMNYSLNKQKYIYFKDNSKIDGINNDLIIEIIELVDFSIPQVKSRIIFGKKILEKNKQILY